MPDKRKSVSGRQERRRKVQQSHPLKQLKSMLSRKKLRRPQKLTEDHILSLLFGRRARDSVLGENLFSDPAYDILLELYAAKLGRRVMSLRDIAQAIEAPESTTGRWVAALEHRGLVNSAVDPLDPTRVEVNLTPEGTKKLEHLLDHWGSAFLSIGTSVGSAVLLLPIQRIFELMNRKIDVCADVSRRIPRIEQL